MPNDVLQNLGGCAQMGTVFVYVPGVNWKMVVDQNVTPVQYDIVVAKLLN